MKVKFLLDWEGKTRGEEIELEDALALELLCDGVVERYHTPKPEAPKPEAHIPETPKRGKK